MAKIEMSAELVADLLFGYHVSPVTIGGASFDAVRMLLEFDVSGQGIPPVDEVTAKITVHSNRRGERFHTLVFESVD